MLSVRLAISESCGLRRRSPMIAGVFLCLMFPMSLGPTTALAAQDTEEKGQELIPMDWLGKKISVEEAEAENPGVKDERISRFPELGKPFASLNKEWEALRAEQRPGDEIWTFSSPADYWKHLAGRGGVALVRHGKVIRAIVTIMN